MRPPAATGPKPMSVVVVLTCSGKSSSPVSIFFLHHNRLFIPQTRFAQAQPPVFILIRTRSSSVYHAYTMTRFRLSSRHSARAALRSGTAEELVHSAAFIARGIPLFVTKSPAWRLQCDADSRACMHGSSDIQFPALLERLAGYYCLNRPIVSYRLDQTHLRFEREDGYCARLSSVTDDEMQNWNGPSASLLFHTPPVLPSGYPAPSWEMSNAEIQRIMPQDWCLHESQWQQEHGCLIACIKRKFVVCRQSPSRHEICAFLRCYCPMRPRVSWT